MISHLNGISQVFKIKDENKLQEHNEIDSIATDQMDNLGCLLVYIFVIFLQLDAGHTVNNLDFHNGSLVAQHTQKKG